MGIINENTLCMCACAARRVLAWVRSCGSMPGCSMLPRCRSSNDYHQMPRLGILHQPPPLSLIFAPFCQQILPSSHTHITPGALPVHLEVQLGALLFSCTPVKWRALKVEGSQKQAAGLHGEIKSRGGQCAGPCTAANTMVHLMLTASRSRQPHDEGYHRSVRFRIQVLPTGNRLPA